MPSSEALNGIEVAGSLGLERSLGAMLVGNAAEPLLALGEWGRAEKMMERALELDPPAHQYAQLQLLLAWLRLWQGDLEQADALLTEFRGLIDRRGGGTAVRRSGGLDRRRAGDGHRRPRAGLAQRRERLGALGALRRCLAVPVAPGGRGGRPRPGSARLRAGRSGRRGSGGLSAASVPSSTEAFWRAGHRGRADRRRRRLAIGAGAVSCGPRRRRAISGRTRDCGWPSTSSPSGSGPRPARC